MPSRTTDDAAVPPDAGRDCDAAGLASAPPRSVTPPPAAARAPFRCERPSLTAGDLAELRRAATVSDGRSFAAEFDDVLQMRLLLEGEAAQRGAHRLDAAGVDELGALEAQMTAGLAAGDAKAYLDANELFHVRLYQAAASPTLMALIETVWLKVGPLSNRLFEAEGAGAVLNDAHGEVMAALRRKDSAGVRRAIEKDLFVAGQFLRSFCA